MNSFHGNSTPFPILPILKLDPRLPMGYNQTLSPYVSPGNINIRDSFPRTFTDGKRKIDHQSIIIFVKHLFYGFNNNKLFVKLLIQVGLVCRFMLNA